jgi:hypothetical protein
MCMFVKHLCNKICAPLCFGEWHRQLIHNSGFNMSPIITTPRVDWTTYVLQTNDLQWRIWYLYKFIMTLAHGYRGNTLSLYLKKAWYSLLNGSKLFLGRVFQFTSLKYQLLRSRITLLYVIMNSLHFSLTMPRPWISCALEIWNNTIKITLGENTFDKLLSITLCNNCQRYVTCMWYCTTWSIITSINNYSCIYTFHV